MEKKKPFKMVVTYDSNGDTIENMFYNILKQKILSCEDSGLDSQQAKEVQYKAQDK